MQIDEMEQQLNKLSENLRPDESSKIRVQNLVFGRFQAKTCKRTQFNFLDFIYMRIFKNKAVVTFAVACFACIIFTVPLLWMGLTQNKSQLGIDKSKKEISLMYTEPYSEQEKDEYYSQEMLESETVGSLSKNEEMVDKYEVDSMREPSMPYPSSGYIDTKDEDTITPQRDRAQRRDAYISFSVENFTQRQVEITDKISAVGGYLAQTNTSTSGDYSYGSFTVRVPVGSFDDFMNFLRKLAVKIDSENISITDRQNELTQVTKTIQTQTSRIEELEAKTNPTQDEKNELSKLKKELEASQSQQDAIKEETEFSTVEIYMSSQEEGTQPTQGLNLRGTIEQVLDTLLFIVKFWANVIIWLIVPVAFFAPVVFVVWLVVKIITRKKKL
jgi:hypothetical protein